MSDQRTVVEKDRWGDWRVVGGADIPRELAELALGRILRMGSRLFCVVYDDSAAAFVVGHVAGLGGTESGLPVSLLADPAYHPNYARDYRKGAQGDV